MDPYTAQLGVLDHRFLARSLGLLNPPPPVTALRSSPVRATIELLRENRIGCVIITDDDGRISGIFSERDVLLKVVDRGLNLEHPVAELMTKEPQTAQMTTTIAFALNMMSHGGYRHLPIVDDDQVPVGIVSVKNIVDYIVSTLLTDLEEFQ